MNLVDPSGFDSCPPVTYETEGGSVTVYPTGCGQSGNGEPTTSQQQNQQSQTIYQQNSQNSQQTTQYYADQSQQRTAEQRQAQNMLPNDAKDLGFTNPYTSPNPNDLNNGGPRLGDAYPDRLAQAVPIGITPGLPIPLPLPPVPTPKQMERIVDATWDFVKWVAQNPLTGLTIAISVANQIKDALSTPPVPDVDHTGKVHGDIPDVVPEKWTSEQRQEAIEALQRSIERRQTEQLQKGEDPGHRERLRQEEQFLRKLLR